ncbi:ribosomal protein L6 [Hysterangium stoloniferum]|nr:ribosomal protein L6 [Hysterangium stoloniferum]
MASAARIWGRSALSGRHAYPRPFSTSTAALAGSPCYIGRAPITLPPSVTVEQSPNALHIKGPLGSTSVPLHPFMTLTFKTLQDKNETGLLSTGIQSLLITVEKPNLRAQRSLWGLTRTLVSNAITGMTEGFLLPLHLVGVGYRAALEPDPRPSSIIEREGGNPVGAMRLNMKLGFSHSVFVPVPPHIKVEVPVPTRIMLVCTDKQQLGLFAARVRSWRKPEPYKGKGIFVGSEVVRIKSVKKK